MKIELAPIGFVKTENIPRHWTIPMRRVMPVLDIRPLKEKDD